ncbi:MAG: DUF2271 domain-containing protein [Clostridiales bacterium]|nr:DUF2271 domain-containing protein [Clostridiales bacterium]
MLNQITKQMRILAIAGCLLLLCLGGCGRSDARSGSSAPSAAPNTQSSSPNAQSSTPSNQSPAPSAQLPSVNPDAGGAQASQDGEALTGAVEIRFDFVRQSGYASNQFAVWIEDLDGDLVKTLYATRYTAGGGYKDRPDSIPIWVAKSGLASMDRAEVEAVSGATPATGALTYRWDMTGEDGKPVQPGEYRFFVEGSLRWKNAVHYSGVIQVGDAPDTAEGQAEFLYEASGTNAALTEASVENRMIGPVTASYR